MRSKRQKEYEMEEVGLIMSRKTSSGETNRTLLQCSSAASQY